MTTTYPGSLALQRKHGQSFGDDGTTTRAGKAAEMAGGINLRDPVRSIRRHVANLGKVAQVLASPSLVGPNGLAFFDVLWRTGTEQRRRDGSVHAFIFFMPPPLCVDRQTTQPCNRLSSSRSRPATTGQTWAPSMPSAFGCPATGTTCPG